MAAATPRMRAIRDSDAAFRAAIDRGLLSEDAANERFAGWYMYMFHDTAGAAWFKHRETRRYVTLAPATCDPVERGLERAGDDDATAGDRREVREAEAR